MNQVEWPGARGLPQVPFKRLFKPIKRPVPDGAGIVTAYTDGQVTLRSNRTKIGYHEAADTSTYLGVKRGDFVVHGLDIMRGSVGVSDSDGAISPVCTVCLPVSLVEPRYAAYAMRLQAASDFPRALARGVREGGADFRRWDTLAELPLPVPPVDVQRAIADFLDRETAQIDAFIAKNEELIALLAERRAAVVAHAITKGLRDRHSDDPIWSGVDRRDSSSLDRTAAGIHGVTLPQRDPGTDPDGGLDDIRCIRVADFDRPLQRVHDVNRTLRKVTLSERAGRVVRAGDLLLEKSGGGEKSPVGFTVLYDRDEPAVCSNFVARVVLAPGMEPRFWTYVHGAMYRIRLTERSLKQSTGIQNLDQAAYFNELAPVPPLHEQAAIADYLDRHSAQIDVALETAWRAVDLARERRAALISAAVTGKIDLGVSA